MALYDFDCDACYETSELLVNRSELVTPLIDGVHIGTPCPRCGCAALRKIAVQRVAPPVFRGEGWARDGYASSSARSTPSNEG
jgi:predicted nucleic acid-binding Zn ribbon protein